MDLQLGGRICLVTGASSGIGHAAALALAAEGAAVVATARAVEQLRDLEDGVRSAGGRAPVLVAADLATEAGPRDLAGEVLARMGAVDVLVNSAGGSRPLGEGAGEEDWSEAFRLNFDAARRLSEAVLPGMSARGWGRIVNVTGAILGKAMNAAAPAKAALESWSKAAAAAYARRGVTVNCVAPGRISSRQILEVLHPTAASRAAFIAQNIPAGRFGEPGAAASLIAFLASGPASYVTGATVPVDGGAMRLAF
jgi:3-oxoacyl-[acyl-carrier protein] reductase